MNKNLLNHIFFNSSLLLQAFAQTSILITFLFFPLMAQETPTAVPTVDAEAARVYADGAKAQQNLVNGQREGHWVSRYPNGNKESDETFSQGKRIGTLYRWYEDGMLKMKIDYTAGTYYLHRLGEMVDGTEEGHFDQNENLIGKWVTNNSNWGRTETLYENGFKEGPFYSWNKWGDLIVSGTYRNGKLNGHWTEWSNDNWRAYQKFRTVKMTGPRKFEEGDYVMGEKNGIWIFYSDAQNLKDEYLFQNGKQISLTKYAYDGKIASKFEIQGDRKTETNWYQNGNMESQTKIAAGLKISTQWNLNGSERSVQEFKINSSEEDAEPVMAAHSHVGTVEMPEKISDNGINPAASKSSRYITMHEDGDYLAKATGTWKFWDADGKLLWSTQYNDGVLIGWSIYDEDSKKHLDLNIPSILKVLSDEKIVSPATLNWPEEMQKINAYLKNVRGPSDETVLMAYGYFLILDENYGVQYRKDLRGPNSGNFLTFQKINGSNQVMFTYMSSYETGVRFDTWSDLKWDKDGLKEISPKEWTDNMSISSVRRDAPVEPLETAKLYYRRHEYQRAIDAYKNILLKDPNNAEVYGLMGYSYYRNQQIPQAVEALQTSLKINPNEAMSHYNLAIVFWNNHQKADSIMELKELFELDPKYMALVEQDFQFKKVIKDPKYHAMFKKNEGVARRN